MKVKLFLLLLACGMEMLLLRLGFWQLDRADEKQQQITLMQQAVVHKKARALAQLDPHSKQVQWVEGQLRFLTQPVILLDNQRNQQAVGVVVYQVALTTTHQPVLVELGWMPVSANRSFPKPKPLSGDYQVGGLMLPPPSAGFAIGRAMTTIDYQTVLLTRIDMQSLASSIGQPLASRVLRLDPALPIGFARSLQLSANTLPPEKHRAYAVQWFALALAFFCLCLYVLLRKKS